MELNGLVVAFASGAERAGETSIDQDLLDAFLSAGSLWVLWLLIGLSVLAVAVIVERIVFYVQASRKKERLDAALHALVAGGPEAAKGRLEGDNSLPGAVARACLDKVGDGPGSVEAIAASAVSDERLRYERGLSFLGTLGNNAPFIGLFGTVLGIIRAFHDLSLNTAAGSEAVMAGIAEALVATGVGLLVALPAVAAYNAFSSHVEKTISAAESATHAILAHIKAQPPERATLDGGA